MRFPQLSGYAAFKLPDDAKTDELLQGETVAIAAAEDGILISATQVQTAGVLDDTYAPAAEALNYGAQMSDGGVNFRLWAPPRSRSIWCSTARIKKWWPAIR